MKKNILSTIIALLLSIGAQAQDQELFNHMSASIGLGVINGITAEVAFPMTHSFALRAGYDYWPTTKMSTDLNIVNVDGQAPATAIAGLPSKMEVEYKDYFPHIPPSGRLLPLQEIFVPYHRWCLFRQGQGDKGLQ